MKNRFYQIGYEFGFKHGPVKAMKRILEIDSNTLFKMSADTLQNEIIQAYVEVEETLPDEFIRTSIEKKELNYILFGYTEGKRKHIRNKADKKYHEKIKLKSKSYKLHEDVIEAFAGACKKKGTSLSNTLERLMMQFVKETEEEE